MQRHRRDLARPMAALAVGLQNREDVFIVGGPALAGEGTAPATTSRQPAATARDVLITSLLKTVFISSGRPPQNHNWTNPEPSARKYNSTPEESGGLSAISMAEALASPCSPWPFAPRKRPMATGRCMSRDLAGTKFSPLKQINADNVGEAVAGLEPGRAAGRAGTARGAGSPAGRAAGWPQARTAAPRDPLQSRGHAHRRQRRHVSERGRRSR